MRPLQLTLVQIQQRKAGDSKKPISTYMAVFIQFFEDRDVAITSDRLFIATLASAQVLTSTSVSASTTRIDYRFKFMIRALSNSRY